MWCIVNLPNGNQQAVKLDPKAIGQECLEKVCRALDIICEMEYFGLEHWNPHDKEPRTHQWINLRNRLTYDSNGIHLMLALRVKFWVPVHFILQESVRNLFYMQAKSDLLGGRLNALDWKNAAKLAALLCQADGIRFNPDTLKSQDSSVKAYLQKSCTHNNHNQKKKKEKEHVLYFKKRRLSKQKSIENIENIFTQSSSSTATVNSDMTTRANGTVSSEGNQYNTTINPCTDKESIDTAVSPLCIYNNYIIRTITDVEQQNIPDDFLHQIAIEHGKLSVLKMTPNSAKYWLLKEISELPSYGEEIFTGVTVGENSIRCDAAVGAHGISVITGNDTKSIPFSAIAAAKSFSRVFKLEYVDDHGNRKELEIKLQKQSHAAGLYRSVTERHAFYVCDKVRGVVTNQFTRDLKGTIASMFNEDTELGKRYVFDIQHTIREVHDQARRTLYERGIQISSHALNSDDIGSLLLCSPTMTATDITNINNENGALNTNLCNDKALDMGEDLNSILNEREKRAAMIERCVELRISEAMTCKICMDKAINTMFNPCCHVIACSECAARCQNCPNCRVKVTNVVRIFLPPELRTSLNKESSSSDSQNKINTSSSDKAAPVVVTT